MAKIQIKSEKLTPFGGIFSMMEQFDALLAQIIDSTLGLRCTLFGYQYSEILRSLMCVYLCGGSCIEDILKHLMKRLFIQLFVLAVQTPYCVPPAESRPLCSSSSLFLQNGLKRHVGTY